MPRHRNLNRLLWTCAALLLSAGIALLPHPARAAEAIESKTQRHYKSYDFEERAENMLKQVRLSIPEGLATVRGILVVSNPSGGDTRDWQRERWYGEFLFLHDFAFVGTKGFTSHVESVSVLQHALARIAADSEHPELVNAPIVVTGFSAGGGFSSRLLVETPERVIASVPVCSRLNLNDPTSDASLHTPACIISGELEKTLPSVIEPVLEEYRPKGACFGWMTVEGAGHSRTGQEVLAMAYLDTAVRLRYPADADARKGPVALKPLDPKNFWVADNTTWKSGLTSIAPADQFKGAIGKSSCLPNEDLAFIFRAYSTYQRPLTIVSPQNQWSRDKAYDPGTDMPITVDASKFPGWKKLEFYDGAKKLGETEGGTTKFTATSLQSGFHVFTVLGTGAQGELRTSNPVLVIVRK